MSDRHFQTSAGSVRLKIDSDPVTGESRIISRCLDCSSGEMAICGRYGKRAQYPASGPIPTWCRLRNAPNPLDE